MPRHLPFFLNFVAILILVYGIYFPRHRRRDMTLAYVAVNVGVLAVAEALSATTFSLGLGLGLFGVLSIIRLRSDELGHVEIAYYFMALSLGILGGFDLTRDWLAVWLMLAILVVMFVGDHPRLFPNYRTQVITLDRAVPDESELRAEMAALLGGEVISVNVRRTNLVNDTTVAEVRYRLPQ
mgnify:CR=1 FL=1